MKAKRQALIREIVESQSIQTQEELAEALRAHGMVVTQATVSRDIGEIGLLKSAQGFYALPEDMVLERVIGDMAETFENAGNLLVIKTRSGGAPILAEAIDNTEIEGLVGSVAGDNTILVVAKTPEYAAIIENMFMNMRK